MSKKVELSAEERAQLVAEAVEGGGTRGEYRAACGAFPSRRYTLARGAHQSPSQGLRVRTLGGASASRIAPADSGPHPDLGT